MAKRKKQTKKQNNTRQIIIPVVVVAVIALIAAVVLLRGADDDDSVASIDPNAEITTPQTINPNQYQDQFSDAGHFLLDVRTPGEFSDGHIEGAANIAVETLDTRLSEVPNDQPIVVYCRSGNRSAQAARILDAAGYTNVYDLGGIIDWTAAGFALVQ